MTTEQRTPSIADIYNRLSIIASQVAGFSPILESVADRYSVGFDASNAMETISGMADHVSTELLSLSSQLEFAKNQ